MDVPPKQIGYEERVRPATQSETPQWCPLCRRFVKCLREHAAHRHLPWWADAVAACAICEASCGTRAKLRKHVELCHEGSVGAMLTPADWFVRVQDYLEDVASQLNRNMVELIEFVNHSGFTLANFTFSSMSKEEKEYHDVAETSDSSPFNPTDAKTSRDLGHWKILLRLVNETNTDRKEANSFSPWLGYSFVIPMTVELPRRQLNSGQTSQRRPAETSQRCTASRPSVTEIRQPSYVTETSRGHYKPSYNTRRSATAVRRSSDAWHQKFQNMGRPVAETSQRRRHTVTVPERTATSSSSPYSSSSSSSSDSSSVTVINAPLVRRERSRSPVRPKVISRNTSPVRQKVFARGRSPLNSVLHVIEGYSDQSMN